MSTTEPRQASDIARDIETLRDDELYVVSGGFVTDLILRLADEMTGGTKANRSDSWLLAIAQTVGRASGQAAQAIH